MASQANLKTVISADMSGFSATMRRAGSVASQTGKNIGRSMAGATQAIGGLAIKAASFSVALGGVAVAAAAFRGVKLAADMESTSVAFETLIGDAGLAQKTLEQLQEFAASTPFEFPEIANAGRTLIAFGESAETVRDALRKVGDIASGVQAPIGEIAELYGKARVQGTLFAEDINQLTGRGIPIIQQFAKQLGVSEGEIKKLASQGLITFPMLEQAFSDLTGKGGQFFQMMDKQSLTFNGLLSTLKDNLGAVLREFGKPIVVALKPVLDSLIASTKDWSVAAAKIGEKVAGLISFGKETIDAMIIGSLKVSEVLSGAFQVAALAFQEYMSKSITFVVELLIAVFSNGEMWKGVGNAMFNGFTSSWLYMVDDVMSGFENAAKSTSETMADAMQDALSNVDFAPSESLKEAAEAFREMVESSLAKASPPIADKTNSPKTSGGAQSESVIYDKELEEQRKRVAADAAAMAQSSPVKWGGDGQSSGNRIDTGIQQAMKASRAFGEAARPSGRVFGEGANPSGRAFGVGANPSNRVFGQAGEALGKDNIFAKDRARLGIKSGLGGVSLQGATGGLGAVRAVGRGGQKEEKQMSLAEQQLKATEEVAKNTREALTVG